MKKTKKSIATDEVLNKSVNKGQINTQTKRDSLLVHDDNMADQPAPRVSRRRCTARAQASAATCIEFSVKARPLRRTFTAGFNAGKARSVRASTPPRSQVSHGHRDQ